MRNDEIELAQRMEEGDEEAKKESCRSELKTCSQHCKDDMLEEACYSLI